MVDLYVLVLDCVLPLLNLAWSVLPPLISPLKPIFMMVLLLMMVGLSSSKVVDLLHNVPQDHSYEIVSLLPSWHHFHT